MGLRERRVVVVLLQQVHCERWNERSREEVGGEHREDHGLRERNEEKARDAREEEHRQEHDADTECGDERGDGDLRSTFEDGILEVVTFFEIALNVLDGDGCVVNEDADGEREATERHDVDGLADEAEDDDRGENRERNGDGDDQCRAP